jgi:hypothetical protein
MAMTCPLCSAAITPLQRYYEAVRPRIGTFGLAIGAACAFSLIIAGKVLTFRYKSLVEVRTAYMPDAAWVVSGISQADPGGWANLRFSTSSNSFRHLIGGSLTLASLNHI